MTWDEQSRYMISFLLILVLRNGGTLVIDNLSEIAGMTTQLEMELDKKADRVMLSAHATPPRKEGEG